MNDPRSRIKGRLGEALVAAMLEESGWQVRPFGLEQHFPLAAAHPSKNSAAMRQMRTFPDFVVYDPRSTLLHPYFVEVKTHLGFPDWTRYKEFEQVLACWVSPDGILAAWLNGGDQPGKEGFRRIEAFDQGFAKGDPAPFHEAARRIHQPLTAARAGPAPRSTPTSGRSPAPSGSTPSG